MAWASILHLSAAALQLAFRPIAVAIKAALAVNRAAIQVAADVADAVEGNIYIF